MCFLILQTDENQNKYKRKKKWKYLMHLIKNLMANK